MNAIPLKGQPLSLGLCFMSGQAFGWEKDAEGVWQGVAGESLYRLRAEKDCLYWEARPSLPGSEAFIRRYLRLDEDVGALYARLAQADPGLAPLLEKYRGLRILRQEAEETFFSFMASACNNIPRITAGLAELRELAGAPVWEDGRMWKRFPAARDIARCSVESLTAIRGLAFRGRNMRECAQSLPEGFFAALAALDYPGAKALLTGQKYIGAKLADCICLFGLGFQQAVPVDTHVFQIGMKYFGLPPAGSVTPAVYERTAAAFRSRYGDLAGWGQQFLFLGEIDSGA